MANRLPIIKLIGQSVGLIYLTVYFCTSYADVQRITNFQYDESGNIVRLISAEQFNAPELTAIDPNFINIGRTVTMTATGSNLLDATVSTSVQGLQISHVNASLTQVVFRLTATVAAPLGEAVLTFTTGLGSKTGLITVAGPLPTVITAPSPLTIPFSGQTKTIRLLFSEPRPEPETYTVTLTDTAIAESSQATVSLSAGQKTAEIEMTGHLLGTTSLNVVLADKFYFFSFPVFVAESYTSNGEDNIFATPVAVNFLSATTSGFDNPLLAPSVGVLLNVRNPVFAPPVGIQYQDSFNNPVFAPSVGIMMGISNPSIFAETVGVNLLSSTSSEYDNPLLAPSVGVLFDISNPVFAPQVGVRFDDEFNNPVLAPQTGVIFGPLLETINPEQILIGNTSALTISGYNLQLINSIEFSPSENINIDSFDVAPDGQTLNLQISVDAAAVIGTREIILSDPDGEINTGSQTRLTLILE